MFCHYGTVRIGENCDFLAKLRNGVPFATSRIS
jgi:hypothetical protein